MTDIGDRLMLPGTYDWQVSAYNAAGSLLGAGPEGRFTIADVASTSQHALAIGGRQLDPNNPATKTPCNPLTGPCVVPTTPVLKWKAQPYTSYYMVYVSRDAAFTNLLEPSNAIPATTNSMYAPALDNRFWTYPDTEAGEALYWFIRPCRKVNNCADSPVSTNGSAQHSFTKTSPKVDGLTSTDPTKSEITFSWNDYYDTNRSIQWAQTGEDRPQSAMQYRIQVDDTESFGTTRRRWSTSASSTRPRTPRSTSSTPRGRSTGASRPSTRRVTSRARVGCRGPRRRRSPSRAPGSS